MLSNKKIGSSFEKEFCHRLSAKGYWVHFIAPDARGAQPFDVIAVKDGKAFAIDCKTCVSNLFSINRLEDNQKFAFEKWAACGNGDAMIAVKHEDEIFIIMYSELKMKKSIRLNSDCIKDERRTFDNVF